MVVYFSDRPAWLCAGSASQQNRATRDAATLGHWKSKQSVGPFKIYKQKKYIEVPYNCNIRQMASLYYQPFMVCYGFTRIILDVLNTQFMVGPLQLTCMNTSVDAYDACTLCVAFKRFIEKTYVCFLPQSSKMKWNTPSITLKGTAEPGIHCSSQSTVSFKISSKQELLRHHKESFLGCLLQNLGAQIYLVFALNAQIEMLHTGTFYAQIVQILTK